MMDKVAYRTAPIPTPNLPDGIPYIIGNEAAERFSFYGMKGILTVFMIDYLHLMTGDGRGAAMGNAEATEHYHTFTAAVYFFPIFGALIADAVLGKYRTILALSIVYCLGHLSLAFMGTPPLSPGWWLFAGLLLISVGSGGIKPCVSAHVGDQFGETNSHMMSKVFQWFYFSINVGAFASTLLTPWLLEHYGPHWAFGVPGVLMALATFMFWMGRRVFIHIPPGEMAFIRETFSREGLLALLKLSIIFSFVAVFWALFDQTGSSWVLQAEDLNRNWLGVDWLKSQIQAVNPIMVLALIPLFQYVIYPGIDKVFRLTPIRKISLGLFVMVLGFSIVAVLQERIDSGITPSIAWQILAYAILTASEVMVSITCLEFAYTQSPRQMKSIVMAVFLMSVSLGNVFTAIVNHYIQMPSISRIAESLSAEPQDSGRVSMQEIMLPKSVNGRAMFEPGGLRLSGQDGQLNSTDDILFTQADDGSIALNVAEVASLELIAGTIRETYFSSAIDDGLRSLPTTEQGNGLLSGMSDARGEPLQYKLITRNIFRITAAGGNGQFGTPWDVVMTGTVHRVSIKDIGVADKPMSWRERRMIDVFGDEGRQRVEAARGEIPETTITTDVEVGGQVSLEGSDYFWFWTWCILITAFVFVPVGYLYREKTYIQPEVPESHTDDHV